MTFCSVQDAVNLLTLFKYLLVLTVSLLNKTSIDGSIFYLYYLYCLSIFQRTCCFRFKSGRQGKGFIFNYQTFSEVFFQFFFSLDFSGSLCERERMYERITLAVFLCESDCKDKNFIYYNPNFFGSFLFFSLSMIPLFTKSIFQGFLLLESGCKSTPFWYTLQIYQTIFSNYF